MAVDYLTARERYKVAFHRWNNHLKRLMELLQVESMADVEAALQERRGDRHLDALAQDYARLGLELDQASDAYDLAQALQARKTAAATAQLDKVFAALDC